MYEEHFGFSGPLFGDGLAQDEAVFMSGPHARLAKDLEIALSRRDAAAALSGQSGTGKSTLAGHALRGMSTRLAFRCISHAPLTAHELLEQLLCDFGFEPYRLSRVERLQTWRQFLSEMTATDTRVCLLIENAESLDVDVLKALHGLTVADATQNPGANVVLTTTQSIDDLLAPPMLQPLRQRVRLRRDLAPLGSRETRDYLTFKAARAGSATEFFDEEVGATIHALTGGIVRVIDNLLESSLMLAAAKGEPRLTGKLVRAVAAEHFGIEQAASASTVERLLAETAPASNEREPSDETRATTAPHADAAVDAAPDPDRAEIPTLTDSVPALDEAKEPADSGELELDDFDGIVNARVLEDISSSMAETIFGNADHLDPLAAGMAGNRSARRP
jgi:general secretion pathway protein A